jgi:hypothetical protein
LKTWRFAAEAALCLLAAVLPFNGVLGLKRMLLATAAVAAVGALYGRRTHWSWRTARELFAPCAPLLIFSGYCFLSMLWSEAPVRTLRELYTDIFVPLVAVLVVLVVVDRPTALHRLTLAVVCGFTAAAVVALAGVAYVGLQDRDLFLFPVLHGEGQLSTYAVFMLAPILWLALHGFEQQRRADRLLACVALLCQLSVGLLTLSRIFWVANLTVLAVMLCGLAMCPAFQGRLSVRRLLPGLAVLLLVHIGLYWWVGLQKPVNYLYSAAAQPQSIPPPLDTVVNLGKVPPPLLQSPSAVQPKDNGLPAPLETLFKNERYEIWSFWWRKIAQKPWLGYGFGMTVPPDAARPEMPAYWPALFGAHAHNRLLDILAQLGVVGLVLWILVQAQLALHGWQALRRGAPLAAAGAIAVLGLIVAYWTKNLTDDFMSRNPLFFYWVLTALYGMSRAARHHAGEPSRT